MKEQYLGIILAVERLHRRFLDVVKSRLDAAGIEDINNIQTLILYNIGNETLSIGELTTRGYYLGSNVSYNIKKMSECGYLENERSAHDRRSVKVQVSEKGREIIEMFDGMFSEHVKHFDESSITGNAMMQLRDQLNTLEDFWSDIIAHRIKH